MSYNNMKGALELESALKHFHRDRTLFPRMRIWASKLISILWLALSLSLLPGLVHAEMDPMATTGSISGEVRITRNLTAQRMRFRLYPGFKPIPPPTAEEKRDDEWRNIVIYLKSTPSMPVATDGNHEYQIAQLGETFIPHVVEFPNLDPIFHNVFSLSGTKSFDLGRYPKGDSRSVTFDEAGIVPVFCHLHSDMSAIIVVLDNPYFVVPGPDGHYQIENIPAGNYTLVAWHERSEQVEQQVDVIAGQALELNLTVPVEDEESSGH